MSSSMERLRRLQSLGKKPSKSQMSQSETDEQTAVDANAADAYTKPRKSPRLVVPSNQLDKSFSLALPALDTDLPLQQAIPGHELENDGGHCYAVAHAISLSEVRGNIEYGEILQRSPNQLASFHPNFNLDADASFRSAIFLDTETTGLGAGAGVYCFMVGVGRFESYPNTDELTQDDLWTDFALKQSPRATSSPTHFVVRQLFMRRASEELALLTALADLLRGGSMSISFNGRVFDLPLLRTRYLQNRQFLPEHSRSVALLAEERAHLDLLIPARRLWRRRLDSCRLTSLEKQILKIERSADDVPGHMIPLLYAQFAENYLQNPTGEAGYMPSIFYHNQEDIVSMVALTAYVYRLFGHLSEESTPTSHDIDGLDWLSIGCCFEAIADIEKAEAAFTRSLELLGSDRRSERGRAESYRRLGFLYKRRGAWTEATTIWQQWLTTVTETDPTPYIELAKYCEWQVTDLEQAEMWTRWALHNLESTTPQMGKTMQLLADLNHRLARIRRKRAIDIID